MATVKDIYNFIDSIAPFESQEEWDNSGLLVGNENNEVTSILFALDATTDIVEQAIEYGADLVVTHHPVIFKPVSNVLNDSIIYKLINNGISIICAHTNYDKAVGGVNDILCNTIGLNSYIKIDDTCLNIGKYDSPVSVDAFINTVKRTLDCTVRYNKINKKIRNIAVCSGSGCDYLDMAKEFDCDALLTGDASHHAFLDANEMGMLLVAAGHFETENISIMPLAEKIKREFNVNCILAKQNSPIMAI